MNILVIGHSVLDFVHNEDTIIKKPGGIYYTCLGLLNIRRPGDKLHLITSIEKNSFGYFNQVLDKFALRYSNRVNKISRVELFHHHNSERHECYADIADKLEIDDTIHFNGFNGILINMITGFDISVDDLKMIRSNFNGTIYFDLHTLSRDINEKGERHFRVIPNAETWLKNIDILQTNQTELKTILAGTHEDQIVEFCFDQGIKIVIVTKGSKGASVYFRDNGKIKSINKQAEFPQSKPCIGCGDIFGSVFFYKYLELKNITKAFDLGMRTAEKFAKLKTISDNIYFTNDFIKSTD